MNSLLVNIVGAVLTIAVFIGVGAVAGLISALFFGIVAIRMASAR